MGFLLGWGTRGFAQCLECIQEKRYGFNCYVDCFSGPHGLQYSTMLLFRGVNEKYIFCLDIQKVILVVFETQMRIEETIICV